MTATRPDKIDTKRCYRFYTPRRLRYYDLVVHGISNRFFWNCPTALLRCWFEDHVSDNHLDVGVGTGYFLARSSQLSETSRVALLDANSRCLKKTAKRIARLQPEVIQANLAEPLPEGIQPFASISMMYVLHCLPGDGEFRRKVLRNVLSLLEPRGVLFGATILGKPQPSNWLARQLMASYNRRKIFGNVEDTEVGLNDLLMESLHEVVIERVGSVALFRGTKRHG